MDIGYILNINWDVYIMDMGDLTRMLYGMQIHVKD